MCVEVKIVQLVTHCRSVTVHEVVEAILTYGIGEDVKISDANDLEDFYVCDLVCLV